MFKLFHRRVLSPVPESERAFLDQSLLWLASEFSWEAGRKWLNLSLRTLIP